MSFSKETISIVIPVYNEELILKDNILKVFEFAKNNLADYDWQIIISDTNSTDKTSLIAKKLAEENSEIKYFYLKEKGKGLGVIKAWQAYPAKINIFMDADLATDLEALPKLIKSIEEDYDIVIGSRHLRGSEVSRSLMRKTTSRILNIILRITLGVKVKDTACGFKAITKKVLEEVVPRIQNQTWFFDTELLILAQKKNYKIKEIPIIWQEFNNRKKNRWSIWPIIIEYLKEIIRLKRRLKAEL